MMSEVALTAGTIEYEDVGASGPVVVLLHGLLMELTLPMGGHRRPMRRGADLSGPGQARLITEFMNRLDLRNVTLVGCDWGGAHPVAADGPPDDVRLDDEAADPRRHHGWLAAARPARPPGPAGLTKLSP